MPSGVIDQFNLSFPTKVGSSYAIQSSSDLNHWETIESGIDGNGDIIRHEFSVVGKNSFYRVNQK